jgi:hypothetical protein
MKKMLCLAICLFFLTNHSICQETNKRGMIRIKKDKNSLSSYFQKNWALIIGIDDYYQATKLKYAVNDAKSVRNLLVDNFGFNNKYIIELYNADATKENIVQKFEYLINNTEINDRLFIFFGGHGITVSQPDQRERGYILPVDANPNSPVVTSISTFQLNEYSDAIPAKHLYFVIDACYGGLIFTRSQPISASAEKFIEIVSSRRTRQAITAGGRDQPVIDTGPNHHSVFTFHFIDCLKTMSADLDQNSIITASEIASYIMPRVTAESQGQQTPQYGILVGDRGGEFIFVPKSNMSLVSIKSNPENSEVYFREELVGFTPIELELKRGTNLNLVLKKEGFLDSKSQVLVEKESHNINLNLEKSAALKITSSPIGASIFMNGDSLGVTPLIVTKLRRKKYSLIVSNPNFEDYTETIDLNNSDYYEVVAGLKTKTASIITEGFIGKADIKFESGDNSKAIQYYPVNDLILPYGEYKIEVSSQGYYKSKQIVFVDQPTFIFNPNLRPKSKSLSILFSSFIPGAGQVYMGRKRGYWFLAAGSILSGYAIYSLNTFNQFNSNYKYYKDKYYTANSQDDMNRYYGLMSENYNKMATYRNSFLATSGVTGLLWIFNVFDTIMFERKGILKNNSSDFSLNILNNGVDHVVQLTLKF